MYPLLCLTIPYTVASPSPVPLPRSLVVKNGSKICVRVPASIPVPVSVTVKRRELPSLEPGWCLLYDWSHSALAGCIFYFSAAGDGRAATLCPVLTSYFVCLSG